MITPPIDYDCDGMPIVEPTAIHDLERSGTAFPDIKNIIFNTSDGKDRAKRAKDGSLVIDPQTGKPVRETVADYPILATTIYFEDGSKVTVTNSKNDPITDANGNVTKEAYERGIIYALVKRLFGEYSEDDNGNIVLKTEGFGRNLTELVANSYNVKEEAKKREAAKAAAKKAHLEREAAAKANPKKPRKSLAEIVDDLSAAVTSFADIVSTLKPKQEA